MRLCEVEGCHATHYARGYCIRHYQQWRNGEAPQKDLSPLPTWASPPASSWAKCACGKRGIAQAAVQVGTNLFPKSTRSAYSQMIVMCEECLREEAQTRLLLEGRHIA
jgi:hypothetical protein